MRGITEANAAEALLTVFLAAGYVAERMRVHNLSSCDMKAMRRDRVVDTTRDARTLVDILFEVSVRGEVLFAGEVQNDVLRVEDCSSLLPPEMEFH